MRIDPRSFGFAAGMTAAVIFVLCAIAVAIAYCPIGPLHDLRRTQWQCT